jgi:DDE family transposase
VLGVAVCAVLAGARSLVAIGEWASDAPGQVLAALGTRRNPWTGAWQPPAEATVRRVLAHIDPDALDRAIGAWLAGQQPSSPATRPPPASTTRPPRRAVAVDGKTLRGSGHHHTAAVHLLGDGPHQPRGPRPGRRRPHHQRDHPVLPLLDRLDLAATVVTADALHTNASTPTGWSPRSTPPICWS